MTMTAMLSAWPEDERDRENEQEGGEPAHQNCTPRVMRWIAPRKPPSVNA